MTLRNYKTEIALISLVLLMSHGLLLINDGCYWEDWTILRLKDQGWHVLYHNTRVWGNIFMPYLMALIDSISDSLFIYKFVIFANLSGATLCVFLLALDSKAITSFEALWIALLFASYPGIKTWPASILLVSHSACYFLFFLACFVSIIKLPNTVNRSLKVLYRSLSLVLFYLSFNTNSFLSFYFGFLLYWFLLEREKAGTPSLNFGSIILFLRSKLDYIFLPFVFWTVKITFYQLDQAHSSYNRLLWDPISFSKNFLKHIHYTLFQGLDGALLGVLQNPVWSLILILCLFLFMKKYCSSRSNVSEIYYKISPIRLLTLFGLTLLGMALFSYAVVGKSPIEDEHETRHALLTPLPVAILCVAFSRFFSQKNWHQARWILLTALLGGFIISSSGNYLIWQARWIKTRSIMEHLTANPEAGQYSTYIIVDEYPIGKEYDAVTEWIGLFNKIWGGKNRNVFYLRGFSENSTGDPWNDLKRPQAVIRTYNGAYEDYRFAVLLYYYHRLMSGDAKFKIFLRLFTRVEVTEQ